MLVIIKQSKNETKIVSILSIYKQYHFTFNLQFNRRDKHELEITNLNVDNLDNKILKDNIDVVQDKISSQNKNILADCTNSVPIVSIPIIKDKIVIQDEDLSDKNIDFCITKDFQNDYPKFGFIHSISNEISLSNNGLLYNSPLFY